MRNEVPTTPTETLWTAEEAAHYLRCSTSYVYKAASRDKLPSMHIDRMLRFRPADVMAFANGPRGAHVR